MTEQQNPLQEYFRSIKYNIELPSGKNYYKPDVLEYTSNGEVSIMAMTATDEIGLKNPDLLTNGEAIVSVIKSCCPGVKEPKKLLSNDVEVIMMAIKHATYGDDLPVSVTCPHCNETSEYNLNISQTVSNIDHLEQEYTIELDNGLIVYLHPFYLEDTVKQVQIEYEERKAANLITNGNDDPETKARKFVSLVETIAKKNIELVASSIEKLVDPSKDLTVTEKSYIYEFIVNVDKSTYDQIDDVLSTINSIGLKRTFSVQCQQCGKEFDADMELNPFNFFTVS